MAELARCTKEEAVAAFFDLVVSKPSTKFRDFERTVKFWTAQMQQWPSQYVRDAVTKLANTSSYGFPDWADLRELMNSRAQAEGRSFEPGWWERDDGEG